MSSGTPDQGATQTPSNGGRGTNVRKGRGGPNQVTPSTTFAGSVGKMNGHIFTLSMSSNPKHDYHRTVAELRGFAAQECDSPNLLKPLFKSNPERPVAVEPERPTNMTDELTKMFYMEDYKEYRKQQIAIKNSETKLYECILGQCTEQLKAKLKGMEEFEEKDEDKDCAWLLKAIKKLHYKFEEKKDPFMNLRDAKAELYGRYQRQNEDLSTFYNEFKNRVEVVEHQGGSFGEDMGLVSYLANQGGHEALGTKINENKDVFTDEEKALISKYKEAAKERYLACAFLKVVSKHKYKELLDTLQNQVTWGQDVMPKTLACAYDVCQNFKGNTQQNTRGGSGSETGLAFAQTQVVQGTDGVSHPNIACHKCKKKGHYARQCPEASSDQVSGVGGVSCLNVASEPKEATELFGICCIQVTDATVAGQTLLDSQSTHSIFNDRTKLTNIRHCGHRGLTMRSSGGGIMKTDLIGDYERLGLTVWYCEDGLTNILALCDVENKFRVTMDTDLESAFIVHSSPEMKFVKRPSGLYTLDTNITNPTFTTNYSFLITSTDREALFTPRQIKESKEAHNLFAKTTLSPGMFREMIRRNKIKHANVTNEAFDRHEYVYGKDVANIRARTVNQKPSPIQEFLPIDLPANIYRQVRNVNISIDLFYFLGRIFIHSISRGIRFVTTEAIADEKLETLATSVKKILNIYRSRGLVPTVINADNQFSPLQGMVDCHIECVAKNEHVGEVERSIRTQEEHTRTLVQRTPYKLFPRAMADSAAIFPSMIRNAFPTPNNGISKDISPRTIVTGQGDLDAEKELRLMWGSYCEVHEHSSVTNDERPRTIPAISLHPSNRNGGYYFMSLVTGEVINRRRWTEMVLTPDVISRVEKLAATQGMRELQKSGRLFNIPGNDEQFYDGRGDHDYHYEEDEDDEYNSDDYVSDVNPNELLSDSDATSKSDSAPSSDSSNDEDSHSPESSSSDDASSSDDTSSQDERSDPLEISLEEHFDQEANENEAVFPVNDTNGNDIEDIVFENDNDEPEESSIDEEDPIEESINIERNESNLVLEDNEEIPQENEENQRSVSPAQAENQRSDTYDLRNTKRVDYKAMNKSGYTFHVSGKIDNEIMHQEIVNTVVKAIMETTKKPTTVNDKTQVETHFYDTAIKKWGDVALEAVFKEIAQVDNKEVFHPVHLKDITPEDQKKILPSLMTVTIKRSGKYKGRLCIDGRAQDEPKEKTASPTLMNESLYNILMTAVCEERHIINGDVPGAFLNGLFSDYEEKVYAKFTGKLVDVLCDVNEKYKEYVTYENGKKVLYVLLNKALYGTVQAALIWYNMFVSTLKGMGFELNPYDLCVANAEIDGSQCTVGFYVDDLLGTHKKRSVLEKIQKVIENEYGDIGATISDTFTYLGIDFKIDRKNKWTEATMITHLQDAIQEFEKVGSLDGRKVMTPATGTLFEVDPESPLLDERKQKSFRSIVMKLVYVAKRVRLDLLTTTAFLTTRQGKGTAQDWKKLRRLLQYVQSTIDMPFIFAADEMNRFHTFIDVAYAVNMDRKSQTGGLVTFGRGAVHGQSTKQRLNTKSSTEGEVVGCSDYLAIPIWFRYFLQAQGYQDVSSTLYQDNTSAMKIENNGQLSMSKKTKHMEIRYFYVKDRVNGNDIKIKYCPTEKMIADFLTKPLQGELFRKFRAVLMGHVHLNEAMLQPMTCKERVEEKNNAGTNKARNTRSWSEVVTGKRRERTTINDDQGK